MLRESTGNNSLTLEGDEAAADYGIPLAQELIAYAEAVCAGHPGQIENTRDDLLTASEPAIVVDAAGIIADFQGLTRIVDATGTELDERFQLS